MKTMGIRKWTIILLVFSMMFSSFGFVSAAESAQSDVKGHWAEKQLNQWLEKGLIKGYADGTVKPENPVTRAELIALINRAFGFTEKADVHFSDIATGNWVYDEAAKAVKAGYMKGNSDGTFGGNQKASRQEVAAIIARLLNLQGDEAAANTFTDAAKFAPWSKAAIGAAVSKKLMQGYGDQTFRPDKSITRAEAVVALDHALQAKAEPQISAYNAAGTYGPATGTQTVSGDVAVNVPGVTLQNMVINGNLLLAAGIGSGDAFLKNVTVNGTTTVQGGGEHSIHFENSVIVNIIVDKKDGKVRIVVEGSTTIEQATINSETQLELGKDTKISTLIANTILKTLGQGFIDKAIISVEGKDSTFEKQPEKLEGSGAPATAPGVGGGNTNAGNNNNNNANIPTPIVSVAEVVSNVAVGTQLESIGLPSIVQVTLNDGSTKSNSVAFWDEGTPSYDGNTAGTYIFSGTLTFPSGVTNPNNIKATATVHVAQPHAPSLAETHGAGTVPGSIQITAAVGAGNHLVIQILGGPASTPSIGDAVPTISVIDPYTSGDDITGMDPIDRKYVALFESDPTNKVVRFKLITLTFADINPIPALNIAGAGMAPGALGDTTTIPSYPGAITSHLVVKVSSLPTSTPNMGDDVPTGEGVINPYTLGEDIDGAAVGGYVALYYTIAGKITHFKDIQLVSGNINTTSVPSIAATASAGSASGTSKLSVPILAGANHYVLVALSSTILTPSVGDVLLGMVGGIDPYASGTNFYANGAYKYVHLYELDSSSKVVKFKLIKLKSTEIKPIPVGSNAPDIDVMTVPGSEEGTTSVVGVPFVAGNHFAIKVAKTTVTANVGDSLPTDATVTNPYISGTNISGMDILTNKIITVYEVDASNKVAGYRNLTLNAGDIAEQTSLPSLFATVAPGSEAGTTSVSDTINPLNHLVVKVSSSSILTPGVGATIASQGVTVPYTSGGNIAGVDPITNKFVAVYEVNSNGLIVSFQLVILAPLDINGNWVPLSIAATAPGSVRGSTRVTGIFGQANHLTIGLSNSPIITPVKGDLAPLNTNPDKAVLENYIQGFDIPFVDATTNKYLGIYEVDSSNKVVSFKLITLVASVINSNGTVPEMTASFEQGGAVGSTKIIADTSIWNHINHLVVKSWGGLPAIGIKVGDAAPTGAGVINPYMNGDITSGVVVGNYVTVYEVNADGYIVQFKTLPLEQIDIKSSTSAIVSTNKLVESSLNNGTLVSGDIIVTAPTGVTFNSGISAADIGISLVNDASIIGASIITMGYNFTVAYVNDNQIKVTIIVPVPATSHTANNSFDFVIEGAGSTYSTGRIHVIFND
ncbi:S-layer homology domain-containing protein [Cohnella suwonensis]|uniref:S-layer homology domain-containing protein n=1 Tax=Cohnella suwonensis TaxID=696072 RepID=A0ABW0M014_9BACL